MSYTCLLELLVFGGPPNEKAIKVDKLKSLYDRNVLLVGRLDSD